MTDSFVLGIYNGISPLEHSAFSTGFENATAAAPPIFRPSFDIIDSQNGLSSTSSDEPNVLLHAEPQHYVLECGGNEGDLLTFPGFDTAPYESPSSSELRGITHSAEVSGFEDTGFTPELSLDLSCAPQWGCAYDYGSDKSPPSSSSSLLRFSSSFEKLKISNMPSSGSLTSPPDDPYISLFSSVPENNAIMLAHTPMTESPSHSWAFETTLFDPEKNSQPRSMPNQPRLFSTPARLANYSSACGSAQWSALPSGTILTHAQTFTSRCVQPGRLQGEPLRSEWSGKSSKRPRSSSGCDTPSSPSTTDGSPIMIPHDPPQLLDSAVAKGPEGKYVCQCIPKGDSSPCGKGFDRREHLRRHWVTHTGERPFKCRLCGRTFSRNDNLNQHLKTHDNFHGRNSRQLRAQMLHDQNSETSDEKPAIKKARTKK